MTKQSNQPEPLTKSDVEEIASRIVSDVTASVSAEILNVVTERFTSVDKGVENALNRIENILRPTVDKVDDHEGRLKHLETARA
jgi:hypothetical protein